MSMASEGTKFFRDDNLCGFVSGITGLGGGATTVNDVSTLADSHRRKSLGLADEGQPTLTLQWAGTDAEFQGLAEDRADKVLQDFKIEWPDGSEDVFEAFVITFERSAETDNPVTVTVQLDIDGEITTTYPTP